MTLPDKAEITTNPLGITNRAHENYQEMRWVPAHTVPSAIQVVISVVGIIAGATLGVGLTPWIVVKFPSIAVQAAAKSCAADVSACSSLTFSLESAGVSGWLVVGSLLVAIYAFAIVWQAWPASKSARKPKSPS